MSDNADAEGEVAEIGSRGPGKVMMHGIDNSRWRLSIAVNWGLSVLETASDPLINATSSRRYLHRAPPALEGTCTYLKEGTVTTSATLGTLP